MPLIIHFSVAFRLACSNPRYLFDPVAFPEDFDFFPLDAGLAWRVDLQIERFQRLCEVAEVVTQWSLIQLIKCMSKLICPELVLAPPLFSCSAPDPCACVTRIPDALAMRGGALPTEVTPATST